MITLYTIRKTFFLETQKTVAKMKKLIQYLQLQLQRLLKRQMRNKLKKNLKEQNILVISFLHMCMLSL